MNSGQFRKGDPRLKVKTPSHRAAISAGQRLAWLTKRARMPIGSTWIDAGGYVRVKVVEGAGPWKLQHVMVMEQRIGRKLDKGEIVHHVDGDRANNPDDNLYLCRNHAHHQEVERPRGARITLLGIGPVRFHKMTLPDGSIKCARLVKRASGYYLCLFIAAEPKPIPRLASGAIGVDPGFSNLLTTSDGELVEHPRELEAKAKRLAQAQRGTSRVLTARIQERLANCRRDRNHKLSRRLVAENTLIVFSKDKASVIAGRFGKSVASSAHYQLRQMLAYKSPTSGTQYVEVDSRNSTRTCSACGALSGPAGLAGLSVRHWVCPCGAEHDRDINAAINTLKAGAGCAHEEVCHA